MVMETSRRLRRFRVPVDQFLGLLKEFKGDRAYRQLSLPPDASVRNAAIDTATNAVELTVESALFPHLLPDDIIPLGELVIESEDVFGVLADSLRNATAALRMLFPTAPPGSEQLRAQAACAGRYDRSHQPPYGDPHVAAGAAPIAGGCHPCAAGHGNGQHDPRGNPHAHNGG